MSDLSVVLAGGGSAGHVNPLLATAHALKNHNVRVRAVGTKEGLEATLVPEADVELSLIDKVPFPRRPNMAALRFPGRYRGAVAEAGRILDEAGADVAVGFGGFVSTPVYQAAKKRGIPVVIHEQNAKAGLANRYGARFAAAVGLTFPSTNLEAAHGQTRCVGLPLRPAIANLAQARTDDPRAHREEAASRLGLDPRRTTLVVTGGSLGAQHLNDVVISCAEQLGDVQVLHLTGNGKDERVREATASLPHYHVLAYLSAMEDAYAVADLVVCRSGAGTVAELSALGLPGFFVPLPIGNGEQEFNASDVVKAGGAELVRDKEFTSQVFSSRVLPLLEDADKLATMGRAARGVSPVDAAERLAALIFEAGAGGRRK
ncbi:undecaprenyldiphospho-muramoylpentapeptide beta-N-acetylglucosaminyltransferase [Actinomycetaceae bacterium L2_0104]